MSLMGYNLANNEMKKLLHLLSILSFIALFSSCSDDFWDDIEDFYDKDCCIGTSSEAEASEAACDNYSYNSMCSESN